MLDQLLKILNDMSIKIDIFYKKHKAVFIYIPIVILGFIAFLYAFDITIVSLENFFKISLKKPENFIFISLKGGLFYLAWIIVDLKMTFIAYLVALIPFLFSDDYSSYIYKFILSFSYFLKFSPFIYLDHFYSLYESLTIWHYKSFHNDYLRTNRFLKLIFLNSNLPVFFYFGVLFILSTVFSLFFLSYLGLYGVFILNLITITMF